MWWGTPLILAIWEEETGRSLWAKASLASKVSSRSARDITKWDVISRIKQANTQTKPYCLKRCGPKESVQLLLRDLEESAWENYINQPCGCVYRGQRTPELLTLLRLGWPLVGWSIPGGWLHSCEHGQHRLDSMGYLKKEKKRSKVGREKCEGRQREWVSSGLHTYMKFSKSKNNRLPSIVFLSILKQKEYVV